LLPNWRNPGGVTVAAAVAAGGVEAVVAAVGAHGGLNGSLFFRLALVALAPRHALLAESKTEGASARKEEEENDSGEESEEEGD
jgi:hypothetical protein